MKIILTKKSRPAAACAGMTMIEMLFSVAISTLIIAATVALTIFAANTFAAMNDYYTMNSKSRNALDLMSSDVRTSQHLVAYNSNSSMQQLVFTNMNGTGFSYTYTTTNSIGALVRNIGTNSMLLLSNINSLSFNLYTRAPSNNFTFYPTANVASAKLISVAWLVSVPVYGSKMVSSDQAQEAKIVIRN